ncbi:MAG: hypothetical protein NXH88_01695 [Hyphomonas sp.]|nr:hypothetical protein [Hyphomonas sp.]
MLKPVVICSVIALAIGIAGLSDSLMASSINIQSLGEVPYAKLMAPVEAYRWDRFERS